jgi:CRP/FNR family transcriptional regulator, cyclic AMP receptor protein
MIEVTTAALAAHPFLHDMSEEHRSVLAAATADVTFPDRHRLFEDAGSATRFWLIRSGRVILDVHVPGQGRVPIDTIGMGELVGWSWRFPPYPWAFGAVTGSPVEAVEVAAQAVRASCASDPVFAHEITYRLAHVLAKRLQSTRGRLITASMNQVGTR